MLGRGSGRLPEDSGVSLQVPTLVPVRPGYVRPETGQEGRVRKGSGDRKGGENLNRSYKDRTWEGEDEENGPYVEGHQVQGFLYKTYGP